MALFQTEGWNLDSVAIKSTNNSNKKNKKNNKKRNQNEASLDEPTNTEEVKQIRTKEPKAKKPRKQKRQLSQAPKDQNEEENQDEEEQEPTKPELDLAPKTKLTPLQQKMMAKLTGSRFRWINEQLYTITSDEALKLVKEQPSLFDEYHDGFKSQVQSWPENPVDVFVNQVKERSVRPVNAPGGLPGLSKTKKVVIADMGCGEAQFSLDIQKFLKERLGKSNKSKRQGKFNQNLDVEVHSFDLKKANDRITVADIRNVPLEDDSCTIVIFCLALMGTNFLDFIKEAYRILAPRGELWIAEIKSRFSEKEGNVGEEFANALKLQGFFHKKTDNENKMFTRFEFFKAPEDIIAERKAKLERRQKFIEHEDEKDRLENKRRKVPEGKWLLKPCIYKRR